MNGLNNEFGVSDIQEALTPLADTSIRSDETLKYLDENKEEVARLRIQDDDGTYVSLEMDRTETGEYNQALQDLVDGVEGVGVRNGQVQVYEPTKAI